MLNSEFQQTLTKSDISKRRDPDVWVFASLRLSLLAVTFTFIKSFSSYYYVEMESTLPLPVLCHVRAWIFNNDRISIV